MRSPQGTGSDMDVSAHLVSATVPQPLANTCPSVSFLQRKKISPFPQGDTPGPMQSPHRLVASELERKYVCPPPTHTACVRLRQQEKLRLGRVRGAGGSTGGLWGRGHAGRPPPSRPSFAFRVHLPPRAPGGLGPYGRFQASVGASV